jgi:hypothetical protein
MVSPTYQPNFMKSADWFKSYWGGGAHKHIHTDTHTHKYRQTDLQFDKPTSIFGKQNNMPIKFQKIYQSVQKLLGEGIQRQTHTHRHRHTHTHTDDLISLLSFLESRLKMEKKCHECKVSVHHLTTLIHILKMNK